VIYQHADGRAVGLCFLFDDFHYLLVYLFH
jgi:hypothetical protein